MPAHESLSVRTAALVRERTSCHALHANGRATPDRIQSPRRYDPNGNWPPALCPLHSQSERFPLGRGAPDAAASLSPLAPQSSNLTTASRKLDLMAPRAIFFDMDDTLLDGVAAMTVSWEAVCQEYAPRIGCEDAEALRLAIRKSGAEFWKDEAAVGHWRLDLDEARAIVVTNALAAGGWDCSLAREMALEYSRRHWAHLQPFEDAHETLHDLRAAGYKLAMITNGNGVPQRAKIDRHDFARHMDAIVIEGEFGKGKPEREVFEHALAATGARPEEAWHIGDNLYADVAGAQSAGIHAVWIHRERLELNYNGSTVKPDRIIAHLSDLRPILL
jgi:putative hydrolase of the HAD superfamily